MSTVFAIGILALLLFTMPDTIESFSSSHEFGVKKCEECHENNINIGPVMAGMLCNDCHDGQNEPHFSATPLCISCHPVDETLNDPGESHKNIAERALESIAFYGENEACFLCHTNVNGQLNFSRPLYIEFDMVMQGNDWIIQNLTDGPTLSQWIFIQRDGKSHQWISATQIQCESCHLDITSNLSAHYPSSDRHPVNTMCKDCHHASNSQHAARSILCTGTCHIDHDGNLISQISGQPDRYQSNICIGCHNEDSNNKMEPSTTTTHFKVYLEPNYRVERVG